MNFSLIFVLCAFFAIRETQAGISFPKEIMDLLKNLSQVCVEETQLPESKYHNCSNLVIVISYSRDSTNTTRYIHYFWLWACLEETLTFFNK